VLDLFKLAYKKYGRVDTALTLAGLMEIGNWFDPNLTLETVEEKPPTLVLDVNLLGTLYFARVAAVYLRQGAKPGDDKSLLLTSSLAGFKESPGMFVYQSTKHGILGLMRSLRNYLPGSSGIRVNVICPWMTTTGMVEGIQEAWTAAKLPVNTPLDVAKINLDVTSDTGLNGAAIYVEGGRGWEFDQNITALEPQWLGKEQSETLARGQAALGQGSDWTKPEREGQKG